MSEVLHPEFLSDPAEYDQAARLWQQRWLSLVRSLGEEGLWESPWINTTLADGTALRDGNPIFSAKCDSRRLGIRIIQLDPAEDAGFHYWTDTFAEGDPEELRELVIACALTRRHLADALELMRKWIVGENVDMQAGVSET